MARRVRRAGAPATVAAGLLAAILAAALAGTRPAAATEIGGPGGQPFRVECQRGAFVVGVVGEANNNVVTRVSPICATIDVSGRWVGTNFWPERFVGGGGGGGFSVICPRNTVMAGFEGRGGPFVVNLGVICRQDDANGTSFITLAQHGGPGTPFERVDCAPNQAVGAVTGGAGDVIDRFGIKCRGYLPAPPTPEVFDLDAEEMPDPAQLGMMKRNTPKMQGQYSDETLEAMQAPPSPFGAPATSPPAQPASMRFQPVKAKSGLPLYHCQTLDDQVCKQPVADMFCQQQGFLQAAEFDIDTSRKQADTITGQRCTKSKCKIFDSIVCAR